MSSNSSDAASLEPKHIPPSPPEGYDGISVSRWLMRCALSGALATSDSIEGGAPFASLVNVATDIDAAPILLLSLLASHTRHLETINRCSLLMSHTGKGDALAHPRLTICGRAQRSKISSVRERFLARHPKSALYADFADFSFWRLEPESFHLNGGFGRAARYATEEILLDRTISQKFADSQVQNLATLNADVAWMQSLRRIAVAGGEEAKPQRWRVSGLDPAGFDLLGPEFLARANFETIHSAPCKALQAILEGRFEVCLRP